MWNIFHRSKPIVKSTALLIRLCSGSITVPKGPDRSNPQKWAFMFLYVQEQSEDYVWLFHPQSWRSIFIFKFFCSPLGGLHSVGAISEVPSHCRLCQPPTTPRTVLSRAKGSVGNILPRPGTVAPQKFILAGLQLLVVLAYEKKLPPLRIDRKCGYLFLALPLI